MSTGFRDRVPRLIAEIENIEQDGMSAARKVALLYGTIIDDFLWSADNGMKFTAQNADDFIEAYLEMVAESRAGGTAGEVDQ